MPLQEYKYNSIIGSASYHHSERHPASIQGYPDKMERFGRFAPGLHKSEGLEVRWSRRRTQWTDGARRTTFRVCG